MATPQTQRSLPDVLQDIIGNLQEIIRYEFRLAKTELKQEAARAAKPAKTFAVGLALALYGAGFLLLAAVYGLSMVMAPWLAAVIVGAVLVVVAASLLSSSGKKLKHVNPTPERAIQSMEENVQWTKQQIK